MTIDVVQKEDYVWEVEKSGKMNVPGRIYANKEMIDHLKKDLKSDWSALRQVVNVAKMPGIQKASLAMSDIHPGYGFPIGGVGAFDVEKGVIIVGGVGFDISCGVRTIKTNLTKKDLKDKKGHLAEKLFKNIPAGLGSTGDLKLNMDQIDEVLVNGAEYAVDNGYGTKDDLEFIEENGKVKNTEPSFVSDKAKKRQFKQVGTLGSGNHYLEVQYVDEIYNSKAAKAYGLSKDQILVSIHCGSRALGHQIGTDYLKIMEKASKKYNLPIPEKELVGAPFKSDEGQKYFKAMNCGINTALANRQVLTHLTRKTLSNVMGVSKDTIKTFYDVSHNTAKVEKHDGKDLLVHRKGATRAFGPKRKEVPKSYRSVGQPVIVGGTMGTHSYILRGTKKAMQDTFGSAIHGAGRNMSRKQAKKDFWGETVVKELKNRGIIVKAHSKAGVAEEAPGAYKAIESVVNVMDKSGINDKVVKVKPLISVKG